MKTSIQKTLLAVAVSSAALLTSAPSFAELSANVSVTNNYIWRGLTQTTNDAAVQGGIDYADESGFYAGTWVSNVNYGADDVYSYEHDLYFGFSGESGDFTYDVGYLYYNYDDEAQFDFGEVYGTVGYGGFSASLYLLANTEHDETMVLEDDSVIERDYGFGSASYVSLDYAMPVASGAELGLHVGYHQGDFAEDFNGVPDGYADWAVSIAKDGFSFAVTGTDLDDAGADAYDNDSVKFVVAYGMDFEL